MEYRVQIATVRPGRVEDFAAEWTAHPARMRRRRGFTIVGAWIVEGTDRFMWILGYDGEEGFDAADAAYQDSEERRLLEPDPARLVESVEEFRGRRIV